MVDGDGSDSFEAEFRELFLPAFRTALRILGSVEDAEDVASDAMARALTRWERVGQLPYRKAWVARVSANLAVDRYRRRRPPVSVPDPVPDPAEAATLRLALAAAMRATN